MHIKDSELTTALSAQLQEDLAAAAYARLNTSLSAARMLTPLGNYLVARPAARSAARKITDATDVPLDAAMVLGITADALHVWKADPMLNQVHDHIGSVPLSRITAIRVDDGRTWQDVTITLDDGNEITLQARGAVHAIVSAYDQRGPGA
ncbi:hypothetical protein SAMN05216223_12964 [Actinacidiphila yanglinensis]|uniref:Uncharacterized protein n=1 Tax=Actinacidiphila yanglinensis TaxID=310779 RepID=A0A1H6EAA6_9ACTN|nr:hypothetical protein [Actinacidiphila yanglinensis]SEG94173.1 hypothetical protein SAMN05216223_12964 [Actinacidiphila yanglinensis]